MRPAHALLAALLVSIVPALRAADLAPVDVFVGGREGYFAFRIPSLVTTTKGTLLAFCEGRKTSLEDDGDNDLLLRRSTDGGRTWGKIQLVHEEGGDAVVTIGNPCALVDPKTGHVWLTMNRKNSQVLATHSEDDGATWSPVREITRDVTKPGWGWYAMGPGVGITLERGPNRGRMIFPANHRETPDRKGPSSSHIVYSDDHGATWKLGGSVSPHTNECQVVETVPASGEGSELLINMRNHWARSGKRPELAGRRLISRSTDGGATWTEAARDEGLPEPTCQASLIRHSWGTDGAKGVLVFANPASTAKRAQMTIRASDDEGRTWPRSRLIDAGPSGYSCLTTLKDGQIGLVYESDNYKRIVFVALPLDSLEAAK